MINYQSQKLHTKLSTFLKFMVFRIIYQIKTTHIHIIRNPGVGNNLISFEIPEIITSMIDMDKLPHLEQATNLSERQLSFKERLEGWKIERRQRQTGKIDVCYRHKKSKQVLRSIYEVVIFLMYEICPTTRGISEEEQDYEEHKLWENDNRNNVELYKKLEDEAAEALISFCAHDNDIIANNNDDKPPPIVDVASSSSSVVVNVDDDDEFDLINHIPICKTMEELQEFLINNRKAM